MSYKHRGGYSSSSRKNLIYGIVIVILAALLGALLWMNKVDEDKKSAELQALNKKLYQEEQEKQTALKLQEAEDSFYQKLMDGFDVNVLDNSGLSNYRHISEPSTKVKFR